LDKTSELKDLNIWKGGNIYGDIMVGKDMERDSVRDSVFGNAQINKVANILDGGITEFFHVFEKGGAAIGLVIPIDQVKDIDSAIKEAKDAGFNAEELYYDQNNKYLEIAKYGYKIEDDWEVVEKLKNVAIEVSKEDYSYHIKNLPLTLKTYPHGHLTKLDEEVFERKVGRYIRIMKDLDDF